MRPRACGTAWLGSLMGCCSVLEKWPVRWLGAGITSLERGSHALHARYVASRPASRGVGADHADDLVPVGVRRHTCPVAAVHHRVGRGQAFDIGLKIGLAEPIPAAFGRA